MAEDLEDDDEDAGGSIRIAVSISPVTRAYLKKLSSVGIYGNSITKIMSTLVERGVMDAIEKSWITAYPEGNIPYPNKQKKSPGPTKSKRPS